MKYLVASGCSFTDESADHVSQSGPNFHRSLYVVGSDPATPAFCEKWVSPLADILGANIYNYGKNSSGNSLISRQAIFGVSQLLKRGVDPIDILCGVEWSGPDRHDFMLESEQQMNDKHRFLQSEDPGKYIQFMHSHSFAPGKSKWIILNHNWAIADPFSNMHYNNFYSQVGAKTNTFEKILATQHYLESVGVNYFFTIMSEETLRLEDHYKEDVQYLYDLIEWNKFLPIEGMYEWCKDVCVPLGMKWLDQEKRNVGVKHPTPEMNRMFAKEVIVPYLKTRGYIA